MTIETIKIESRVCKDYCGDDRELPNFNPREGDEMCMPSVSRHARRIQLSCDVCLYAVFVSLFMFVHGPRSGRHISQTYSNNFKKHACSAAAVLCICTSEGILRCNINPQFRKTIQSLCPKLQFQARHLGRSTCD